MTRSTRVMFLALIAALVAAVVAVGRENARLKQTATSAVTP